MNSILRDSSLRYPDKSDFFSPHTAYPEYTFGHISRQPNHVYDAVRQIFIQANLDRDNFGTPEWNPLGEFIQAGSRVFVLCNFVYQRRPLESLWDFNGKCTHGSVLRAVVDYILKAVGSDGHVQFGNAPLQSCHWASVLLDTGADRVLQFYQERGFPVGASDLRLLVAERNLTGSVKHVERRSESEGVQIDLGTHSLLSKLDKPGVHFRILDYDSKRIEEFHRLGKHIYIINRKVLESDVIFSIPKLKTHEKVGITCAIKGCVGAVGEKDSLAHHRFGTPDQGGDEYPSDSLGIRRSLSHLHDVIQKIPLENRMGSWSRIIDRVLLRSMRLLNINLGGSWWGNDTCWRMAVDLARILAYATLKGELQEVSLRPHLSLIDGVVGGEGYGPLAPTAVDSGVLIFSNNLVSSDWVAAIMMGYDPSVLPIVRESARLNKYPILTYPLDNEFIVYNGVQTTLEELIRTVYYHYRPPRGWSGHL